MDVLRVVIPNRCLACKAIIPRSGLCALCLAASPVDGKVYQVTPMIQMQSAYAYNSPVGAAIRFVKATGSIPGAQALADLLAPTLAKVPATMRTYIPAPWIRKRRRGLDLPQWLAGPGARQVFRRRMGHRQHGLTGAERRVNPQRYLDLLPLETLPLHMVLIDDVRTTGATTLTGAKLLGQRGIRVNIVTLAGVGKPRL